jgi:hypothetical protein
MSRHRDKETRRQRDKETRGQGDKETRKQGDKDVFLPYLLVSLSPCLLVPLSLPEGHYKILEYALNLRFAGGDENCAGAGSLLTSEALISYTSAEILPNNYGNRTN